MYDDQNYLKCEVLGTQCLADLDGIITKLILNPWQAPL